MSRRRSCPQLILTTVLCWLGLLTLWQYHDGKLLAMSPPVPSPKRYALLIDSDVHGPSNWALAMDVVRGAGKLVAASVVLAEESPQSKDPEWLSKLATLGIAARIVPAKDGSFEVVAEASELIMTGQADAIALAVKSGDFDFLSSKIRDGVTAFKQDSSFKFEIMEIG
eukprot:TRINITY_DN42043_c0_g1_i1.p1 TRINITY_DN42043_c0_g1~~TRINITY_DN42043_c0_g1_i1.p1  ORF type:complete len:188 (+),score=23.15 TRINITY_DN42043_c0_g1_i1:61-564(+)